MNAGIDRLILYYSKVRLIKFIFFIFFISFMSYILIINKKIIKFFHLSQEIHVVKNKTIKTKQKKIISSNMSHQEKSENHQWLNNRSDKIKKLIETIKQHNFIQYQVNDGLKKNENNFHVRVLELSLTGRYLQLMHWLLYEMPYFCFLKQVTFKKMQKGVVNLIVKVEIYEK